MHALPRLSQFAVQLAVVLAKVARNDYPRQWAGLFGDLLARMQGGSTLTVRRAYLVLHHILKELASKRLPADQRVFAQVGLIWLVCMSCKDAQLNHVNHCNATSNEHCDGEVLCWFVYP